MKNLTALQFQELLRVINCLSVKDFIEIFDEGQAHYWAKFCEQGAFKFICYLDSGNVKALYDYSLLKMERQNG